MCLLFESIKIKDGFVYHLDLHQRRMDRSIEEIFKAPNKLKISDILDEVEIPKNGLFKARVVYGERLKSVEIIPYKQRKIKSLRVVQCNEIEYQFKYADRKLINELVSNNSDVDDIIILRNGLITDSSYSNLIFWNGVEWHTPSSPLLNGIQRNFLLAKNKIKSTKISLESLSKYQKIGLINAMMDIDEMPIIRMDKIQIA